MANENDYDVLDVKLDATVEKKQLIAPGRMISSVTVNSLPVAAVGKVRLHFGESGKGLKLRHESLPIIRLPARTDGLFVTIDQALPGEVLELWVGIQVGDSNA